MNPALAVGSLVVVVALWATGPGAADASASPANLVTALGRLAGLVSADLLLLQVLLMARIPALERSVGRAALARWHRVAGFSSFLLLWLHIGAVTSGYSLLVDANVARQTWDLITNYPGMLLAVAAALALTMVAATSMRVARRALRYESWHLLHLYAYLGVGLALPHQIWTGASFTESPLARVYWLGLYALTAGAVLTYRVGVPVWRTFRHQLTVRTVVRESDDVVSVHLEGRALDRLDAQAGQFFLWRFLSGTGWSHAHPYSLSAPPGPSSLRLTAKGDTARLTALEPGTWVTIEGPYGRLTGRDRTGTMLAMFACGIGITPVRALLEALPYPPGAAVLVYRARAEADLVFRGEMDALAAVRGITVHYLVGPRAEAGPRWLPEGAFAGTDSEAIRHFVPEVGQSDVFVCGPDGWASAVCAAAEAAGSPRARIHVERFAW
ncbi:MAG: ferric reductase-like transmembrane domain-containing protein [Sporichthya sp.]|nr:ferric reductase-like transmembrane domain-containing protein [Sporichthya sp.]